MSGTVCSITPHNLPTTTDSTCGLFSRLVKIGPLKSLRSTPSLSLSQKGDTFQFSWSPSRITGSAVHGQGMVFASTSHNLPTITERTCGLFSRLVKLAHQNRSAPPLSLLRKEQILQFSHSHNSVEKCRVYVKLYQHEVLCSTPVWYSLVRFALVIV